MTSQDVTDWLEFYRLRPFGYVREARFFGTLAAQFFNANRERGAREKSWVDVFPIDVTPKDGDGRDTNETIIKMMQAYNLERGYTADGRKRKSR